MTDDWIGRYARGDLTAAEARNLAQASLDSPELFDELTDSALAKAGFFSRRRHIGPDAKASAPRKTWFVIASLAAAALLISAMFIRPWRTTQPHLPPVLDLNSAYGQPVLLASGLQPTLPPVFRGSQEDRRAPRIAGSIVAIEDGQAFNDLGSVDGLAASTDLQVFSDDRSTQPLGRLRVTTVFRQRARGRSVDGKQLRAGNCVRIDDSAHMDALLDYVAAYYNGGEADAAQKIAEQSSRWVETANISSDKQSAWWNQLAVLRMLRGDYAGAEAPLSRAALSPKSGLPYMRSMNNLGVMAELRADRGTAESRYAAALQALAGGVSSPEQERRAVEANLARLRGRH
jgi:hypothetical protein